MVHLIYTCIVTCKGLDLMIVFTGTSLLLQSIVTAHTLNTFWTTSVWRISHESPTDFYYRWFSRPVRLGIKHPTGAEDQIFITVRQLQACWCGALCLPRGRICRLPESQSAVISLSSLRTTYILNVIKCMYMKHVQGLCQSRLSTADHALSLVAPPTTAV
jgi:hypothetical protein